MYRDIQILVTFILNFYLLFYRNSVQKDTHRNLIVYTGKIYPIS